MKIRTIAIVLVSAAGMTSVTACKKSEPKVDVPTATITRRDISVSTDATGTVEPVDTVAVKPQASGMLTKMPIDVGSVVKVGDLIAQIDTRNLQNDFERTQAAQQAAESTLKVNTTERKREDLLFQQGVITATEHETAVVNEANAQSALVAAQTNFRVSQQNLDYATVRAEVAGTVISKSASLGSVVSSATSNVGGGSTIVTIADLSRVRMRVMVNETDIANVKPGQSAAVTIDALPNQTFQGVVEKVEPQASVVQSVTMFPVLVSLANPSNVLLPGMNGEVTMITQDRPNAIAIPNDAIRSAGDMQTIAAALGLNLDSIRTAIQQARRNGTGETTGARGAGTQGAAARSGGMQGAGARGAGASAGATGAGGAGNKTGQYVFIKQGTGWIPRRVRIGVSNYDYSEALSGVKEGDVVALPAALLVQQQRNQQTQRIQAVTGNGLPGTGAAGGGGRGGR